MRTDFSFFAQQRFFPLFCTQVLSIFNDNIIRISTAVLISYHGLQIMKLSPEMLVNISVGIFILPYFLFSALASRICEKYDKSRVAQMVKFSEIVIGAIAGIGFFWHSGWILFFALFLMGIHSTFYGLVKYSVLPQYLQQHELVGGNGLIEMGTFIAILIGQIVGSQIVEGGPWVMITLILCTAVVGAVFSLFLPKAPAVSPELTISPNIVTDTFSLIRQAWAMCDVKAAILGISWFWLLGAAYTTQLPSFTRLHLGGNPDVYTLLLGLFSLGIGIGSIVCANLSRGRIELGMVLIGCAGLTVVGLLLSLLTIGRFSGDEQHLMSLMVFLTSLKSWLVVICITSIGFFGGFFTVPLYTWLQTASGDAFRSQAIAVNNIVNAIYMVVVAGASALLLAWMNNIAVLLLMVAIGNVVAMWHLVRVAPAIWQTRWGWLRKGNIDS